ncbi:MAG: hypothetical protein K2J07_06145 [Muribaculaceae bacterium]|nr:hypothetical protein [Muribaculaceae bacterium]MDE6832294.1 hypothetical protein [Muribaculaceae bacterium]
MSSIFKRYSCFIIGLLFLSLGVDFIVKSSLGTTPISSVNYVLSLNFPLTLGMATMAFNMVIILLQFWLVRGIGTRTDYLEILFQIPFSFLFSLFIDLNMLWIEHINVTSYWISLGLLGIGCIVQSIGVVLELKPNVAIMSAEGFVKYFCKRYHKNFGKVKVVFDVTLVLSAILLSLIFAHEINGVREGTLVAALSTGFLVNFFATHLLTRQNLKRVKKIYKYPLTLIEIK